MNPWQAEPEPEGWRHWMPTAGEGQDLARELREWQARFDTKD